MWVIQLLISTVIHSPHQFVWHFELVSYKTLLESKLDNLHESMHMN